MNLPRPHDPPAHRRPVAFALGSALLLLALLRIGYVALHQPLAGYANQYDMLRTSACIGWWPALPGEARLAAHPVAPVARYLPGERRPANCYPSTEVLLAAAGFALGARLAAAPDGSAPLAAVGGLKAALLALALIALHWRLRRHPKAALVHAVLAAAVLADPFNTLWLNSLYTEFGALLGAWLALAGLTLRALEPARRGAGLALLLTGLALLGFSRVQHVLLAPALALLLALVERGRSARVPSALALALALSGLAAAQHLRTQERFATQADANRINALFGAILPASREPAGFAAGLGLAPACVELAHATFYLPRGRDVAAECPAAFALAHHEIAAALLAEPSTLARLLGRALLQTSAWRMPYVGELAGADDARLPPGALRLGASLADAVATLPASAYLTLWLVPWFGAALAWLWLLWRPRDVGADGALLAGAGTLSALALSTAVLGDGYSELARHAHLGANGALVGAVALLAGAAARWPRAPAASAVLLAVPLACGIAAASALLRLPLGFGVLTEPRGERVAGGTLVLEGWVFDAATPERVEARLEGGDGVALALEPASDVARHYPLDRGTLAWRFRGTLALPPGATRVPLAIVARRAGIETVIDRRWLVPGEPAGDNAGADAGP